MFRRLGRVKVLSILQAFFGVHFGGKQDQNTSSVFENYAILFPKLRQISLKLKTPEENEKN